MPLVLRVPTWLACALVVAACGPAAAPVVDAGTSTDAGACDPAACDDDDPCTTDACGATGCSHAPAADGVACDDRDACTRHDACVAGACAGAEPVVCAEPKACERPGVCAPSTGTCAFAPAEEGTTCDDGDPQTFADACDAAAHCGGEAVVCPSDTPCVSFAANGTATCTATFHDAAACDDHDACTRVDTCRSGQCVGSDPIACAEPGRCLEAGHCEPATGECAYPSSLPGTSCDDEDLATSDDTCDGNGACEGLPVTCPADDACASWNPDGTRTCVATLHDAAPCDDGNACTQSDSCVVGECVGADPVTCAAPATCRDPGQCEPATGRCTYARSEPGTMCDDTLLTTWADRCDADGACTGTPVTCPANDACVTWKPAGSEACAPTHHDGVACVDDDECTATGVCAAGSCRLPARATCTAAQHCANGACLCPPGFVGANCDVDVDECASGPVCGGGAACTNVPGSHTCQCLTNYAATGGACRSSVPAVRLAIFYDEGLDNALAPVTDAYLRDVFLLMKAMYDASLQPATTLSLNAIIKLPRSLGMRTCDTVDPAQPHCLGCYSASSTSCVGLLSKSATEIDTGGLLVSFNQYAWQTRTDAITAITGGFDVAVLLSGADFGGSVNGLAYVGATCRQSGSLVVGNASTNPQFVAAVTAHELGHTLGMNHDTAVGHLMAPSFSNTSPPSTFSAQSLASYASWRTGLGAQLCVATGARDDALLRTCGNGRLDDGEQCDPGAEPDTCCSPTCQLLPGCACGNADPCCANGAPKAAGTSCRAAVSDCDLADTCDGETSTCRDDYRSPGAPCGTGTCLRRACAGSRDAQCLAMPSGGTTRGACATGTRCDRLECSTLTRSCDLTWVSPAANGTPCGSGSFCNSGLCLPGAAIKDYRWSPKGWGPCAGGVQARVVTCVDETGAVADASNCDPDERPTASRACP